MRKTESVHTYKALGALNLRSDYIRSTLLPDCDSNSYTNILWTQNFDKLPLIIRKLLK